MADRAATPAGAPPVGLVTGGGRGIGLAVARAWMRRGVAVAVVDCDAAAEARVAEAARGATAPWAYFAADVRDFRRAEEVVARTIEQLGGLDYVVLNAGIARDRVSWKMSEEEWDEVIAVNLKGAFNYARAAGARLRERGTGRIVFVASINGLRGKVGQCNYAAAKAGMIGLARSLALELGPAGVTVNVVAPGMIRTPMTAGLPAAVIERARGEAALGAVGEPEDVAGAVEYLCGPAARHVTGAVLRVDGGQALAAGVA